MRPPLKFITLATATLLLALSPHLPLPIPYFLSSVQAQTATDPRKAEADRLLIQGGEQFRTSQFKAALQSWQQALQVYRAVNDRQGEGQALGNLSIAYNVLSNYGKAIEYQEQSLAIARETKDRRGEGQSLGNLGLAYYALGNYGKAIEYQEQSLAIAREIKDRLGEGQSLGNLGNAHGALGDYRKAIKYQEQQLAIAREIKDRLGEGGCLSNLGNAYYSLGSYGKAVKYHEQALTILREIKNRRGEGKSLNNLGNAYYSLGNYGKAVEYHEQALAIARKINNRESEGASLSNLGLAYRALGNYGKAVEYHEQALAIARKIEDRLGEGLALNNLGLALFRFGNLSRAEKILFDGVAVRESIRQIGVGNNDINKVSIFETQSNTYRTLQQVLVALNKPKAALEVAERGRARAFVELLAQQVGSQGSGTRSQENIKLPTIAQLQQVAKAQNATLVQYSIIYDDFKVQGKQETHESQLYIWVIQPTGEITFRKADLKPLWQRQNTSLPDLVTTIREVIGARSRASTLVATLPPEEKERQQRRLQQLHTLLIEPIADLLPKDPNQHVIFLPQADLFLVPFPALRDKNGTFLVEKHTILTAPSIQVLELTHQRRQGVKRQGESLVVGNPTMPQVQTEAGGMVEQLKPLAGSEWEAKEIAALLKTKAIVGNQATKSSVLKQISQARTIHFATHGLLDDFKGLGVPGAIALGPDGTGKTNDGLLTSDEILDLKLTAELVVLSACDTGRGRLTGYRDRSLRLECPASWFPSGKCPTIPLPCS